MSTMQLYDKMICRQTFQIDNENDESLSWWCISFSTHCVFIRLSAHDTIVSVQVYDMDGLSSMKLFFVIFQTR
jgi:hypothetical protein